MTEDVVRAFGYTTLGSRLKRIGERLQAQTQDLTAECAGTDLPTPHNPVLAALDRLGPLSIGDLARALGLSQPGITRMVNRMKAEGLLDVSPSEADRRISTVRLSARGENLVAHLKVTLWPAVAAAVSEICGALDGPLLDQLDALETALCETPLAERCAGRALPPWRAPART